MGTTLLRGAVIVDGSGDAAFNGHVLIEDEMIGAVVKEGQEVPPADTIIDASGLAVAPGFIDMHSHADWLLPLADHPELVKCMLEQGVTTLVGGNCGISPAPVNPLTLGHLKDFASITMARDFDFTWKTMAEFLDNVDETEPVVNLAELVGHASIRYAEADTRRGAMKPEETKRCLDRVRRSFEEGACGLSFGLGYDPGMYSPLDELSALCSAAAEAGRPATVHLKAYSRLSPCYPLTTLQSHHTKALGEMLEIAKRTRVKLQLSHFIFVGRKSWPAAPESLAMVDKAREEGVDVMIDAFPYTCGNTTIHAPFPYWFLAMLPDGYKNRVARARLRAELEVGFRLVGFMYKDFQVMDAGVPGWEDLNGLTIVEIAQKWKTSPFNAMLKLAEASKGATLMLFHTYSGEPENQKPIEAVLSHDLCLFETDVALKDKGYPNPASMGTFPKILGEYVRDKKLFSLESAIKRMTSASAERFGLKDRGLLAKGSAADIVVFDRDKIADTPPAGKKPAGKPKGIEHVFINGRHVVKNGTYIEGSRYGRVIRT